MLGSSGLLGVPPDLLHPPAVDSMCQAPGDDHPQRINAHGRPLRICVQPRTAIYVCRPGEGALARACMCMCSVCVFWGVRVAKVGGKVAASSHESNCDLT